MLTMVYHIIPYHSTQTIDILISLKLKGASFKLRHCFFSRRDIYVGDLEGGSCGSSARKGLVSFLVVEGGIEGGIVVVL